MKPKERRKQKNHYYREGERIKYRSWQLGTIPELVHRVEKDELGEGASKSGGNVTTKSPPGSPRMEWVENPHPSHSVPTSLKPHNTQRHTVNTKKSPRSSIVFTIR